MLTEGEGDLLLWVASISPDIGPPQTKVPTVVLGTPGVQLGAAPRPSSFPVGTPGIDHAGQMVRLRQRRVAAAEKSWPLASCRSAADILAAIEAAL